MTGLNAPLPDRRYDGDTTSNNDVERLDAQAGRVQTLMADGKWRTPADIEAATGDNWAAASARLRDLRKPKFGGFDVQRQHVKGGLFQYRVIPSAPDPVEDSPRTLFDPPAPSRGNMYGAD